MPKIKQLNSKIVYKNKWMTVREDQIERPSGAKGIYGVVDKPHFVIIIPFENGKVHLVEQYRYPVKERHWDFPQGSLEKEPDIAPEKVAISELKEETGLIADKMTHVGFQFQAYGYSSQGYHIFIATGLTKTENQLDIEEEDLITAEFTIEEFEKMIINGMIKDAGTTASYALAKMKKLI